LAAVAGIITVGLVGLPAVAGATGGYPGTVAVPGSNTLEATIDIGQTISLTFCSFDPGSAVTTSLGGVAQGSQAVDGSGCVTDSFTASDPHLAVNGGTPVPANLGANPSTFSAVGVNTTGGSQTDSASITVAPAATAASGLAFTGADIMYVVIGGLVLIALGAFVLLLGRRRRSSAS
jgi:hypothetical protein